MEKIRNFVKIFQQNSYLYSVSNFLLKLSFSRNIFRFFTIPELGFILGLGLRL